MEEKRQKLSIYILYLFHISFHFIKSSSFLFIFFREIWTVLSEFRLLEVLFSLEMSTTLSQNLDYFLGISSSLNLTPLLNSNAYSMNLLSYTFNYCDCIHVNQMCEYLSLNYARKYTQ